MQNIMLSVRHYILLLCCIAVVCVLGACNEKRLPKEVVAEVNGRYLYLRTLDAILDAKDISLGLMDAQSPERLRQEYAKALSTMIIYMLVSEEMEKLGKALPKTVVDDIEAQIRQAYPPGAYEELFTEKSINHDEWRQLLWYQRTLQDFCKTVLRSQINVPLEEVRRWFASDRDKQMLPEKVRVKLVHGKNVERLQRLCRNKTLHTQDFTSDTSLRVVNDSIHEATGEVVAFFKQKKVGQCGTPVAQADGFDVLVLTEIIPPRMMTKEEIYMYFMDQTLSGKINDALNAWLEERLKTSRIRISKYLLPEFTALTRMQKTTKGSMPSPADPALPPVSPQSGSSDAAKNQDGSPKNDVPARAPQNDAAPALTPPTDNSSPHASPKDAAPKDASPKDASPKDAATTRISPTDRATVEATAPGAAIKDAPAKTGMTTDAAVVGASGTVPQASGTSAPVPAPPTGIAPARNATMPFADDKSPRDVTPKVVPSSPANPSSAPPLTAPVQAPPAIPPASAPAGTGSSGGAPSVLPQEGSQSSTKGKGIQVPAEGASTSTQRSADGAQLSAPVQAGQLPAQRSRVSADANTPASVQNTPVSPQGGPVSAASAVSGAVSMDAVPARNNAGGGEPATAHTQTAGGAAPVHESALTVQPDVSTASGKSANTGSGRDGAVQR